MEFALLLVVAPLAEEAVFRGGLMEALLRRGARALPANAITTLAFVAAHALLRGSHALALAAGAASWALGSLYARRRRLGPCIALHALLNAAWIALALAVPSSAFLLQRLG